MARDRASNGSPPETVISIIGPGMTVVGDCQTEGTVRVEGTVRGSVSAGKAVVVGRDGLVEGDITTQDAVISGTVRGALVAESRLELQATCRIEGDIRVRRMQLEEGAILNGTVQMGEVHAADANEATTPPGKASGPPTEVVAQATGTAS
ncbi:MAG: polymer-forming cytoskeletal protein [Gemmatimonadetes bacterium]|nr:polymer-forming cytoskeletal protein [Gemmatimonadota bacterium]